MRRVIKLDEAVLRPRTMFQEASRAVVAEGILRLAHIENGELKDLTPFLVFRRSQLAQAVTPRDLSRAIHIVKNTVAAEELRSFLHYPTGHLIRLRKERADGSLACAGSYRI